MNSEARDIRYVKGVGPKKAVLFNKLGINTVKDLLFYPPFRYLNRKIDTSIIKPEEYNTVIADIIETGEIFTRSRKRIFNALVKSNDQYLYLKWFNNRYIGNVLKEGQTIIASGKVKPGRGIYEMLHPVYELLNDEDTELIHTGRIVPVYHLTEGLSQRYLRRTIHYALSEFADEMSDSIPDDLEKTYNFIPLQNAVKNLHYPEDEQILERALHRFKYNELFSAGLRLAYMRMKNHRKKGFSYHQEGASGRILMDSLTFELTGDQRSALREIMDDMDSEYSMNRLLMGDVGVGKTIVGLLAMLKAVDSGYQTALMAPTEVLAQQHYLKIKEYLKNTKVNIELMTSSVKRKIEIKDMIASGDIDIVIGTHALIEDNIIFNNLRMIIIDEQHRFGVMHREKLRSKANNPDYLIMTATPIPRSMSMMLYGDMEVSSIRQRPEMQKPIRTKWIASGEEETMYGFVRKLLNRGEKAFVVCPMIDNEKSDELHSVNKVYKMLEKQYLPGRKMGKIYSRLPQDEKDAVMHKLKNGDIDVLVGTTVIEVGIDVKDATAMIIINAERFGLSQLHQLRGRVGRGDMQSYCFLVSSEKITQQGIERLKTIVNTNDGFEIAEMDMKIRGPGELWGTKQSGIPQFHFASVFDDYELMKQAFNDARTQTIK